MDTGTKLKIVTRANNKPAMGMDLSIDRIKQLNEIRGVKDMPSGLVMQMKAMREMQDGKNKD